LLRFFFERNLFQGVSRPDEVMRTVVNTTIRISLGLTLIVVGIVGLALPVLPGWAFILPGLVILSDYIPGIRGWLDWVEQKATKAGAGKVVDSWRKVRSKISGEQTGKAEAETESASEDILQGSARDSNPRAAS
jgi:hypothetical protein